MQTVHVRVNDAATGRPTPVRIRFTDGAGKYYAPLGRPSEFSTDRNQAVGGNVLVNGLPFAYIDGACEIRLPAGLLRVEIAKGPEYVGLDQHIKLEPGKLALRFAIERRMNLREQGWYSGDTRAHFLSPHAALLEGMAEDLAVINVLACEEPVTSGERVSYVSYPNLLEFSGTAPARETPGHLVVVNTHNTFAQLGSLGLLGCHRVVFPLALSGSAEDGAWAMADWCDQCHRKTGLVVWTRTGPPLVGHYGEPLADCLLGKIDAVEVSFEGRTFAFDYGHWYDVLACGLRIPVVGGSGKVSNGTRVGALRTYARLRPEDAFTYGNWLEAIRAGRTFVTTGPPLFFSVNGEEPGTVVRLREAGEKLRLRAEVKHPGPYSRLDILANGRQSIAGISEPNPEGRTVLDFEWPCSESAWLVARWTGCERPDLPLETDGFAHTSPVYVEVASRPHVPDPKTVECLGQSLATTLDWINSGDHWHFAQRQRLAAIFQEALYRLSQKQ